MFRPEPLQRVVPAGPAIQNAALDKQHVKQNGERRGPTQAANAAACA